MKQFNDNRSRQQRKLFRLGFWAFVLLVVLVVLACVGNQSDDASAPRAPIPAAAGTTIVEFDGIMLTEVIVDSSTTVRQVAEWWFSKEEEKMLLRAVSAQCAVLPSGHLTEALYHPGWYDYVPLDPASPAVGECELNAVVIWPLVSKVALEA